MHLRYPGTNLSMADAVVPADGASRPVFSPRGRYLAISGNVRDGRR